MFSAPAAPSDSESLGLDESSEEAPPPITDTPAKDAKTPNTEPDNKDDGPDWPAIERMTAEGLMPQGGHEGAPPPKRIELHLGVDEAGRGACLGPMVYGCCASTIPFPRGIKVCDSKQTNQRLRTSLAEKMATARKEGEPIFWTTRIVHAKEIDAQRSRSHPVSLNETSIQAVFEVVASMVQGLRDLSLDFSIESLTVDAIGPDAVLKKRLIARLVADKGGALHAFHNAKIIVESKADANYPIVGAASIWAKLTRDRYNATWAFAEDPSGRRYHKDWGCGYPSDVMAQEWIAKNCHPLFGFPQVARHSWSNVTKVVEDQCFSVVWNDEQERKENIREAEAPSLSYR